MDKYNEVKNFIETNKRNPSRYDDTERGLYCNWLRHNRKQMNAGTLKPERVEMFKELLSYEGKTDEEIFFTDYKPMLTT